MCISQRRAYAETQKKKVLKRKSKRCQIKTTNDQNKQPKVKNYTNHVAR